MCNKHVVEMKNETRPNIQMTIDKMALQSGIGFFVELCSLKLRYIESLTTYLAQKDH